MWKDPIVEEIRAYRDEHARAIQRGQGQVSHFPKIVRHFHNPTHSRVVEFKRLSNLLHAVAARCPGLHDCRVVLWHGCKPGKRRR